MREKLWTAGEVREVEGGGHQIAIHLHLHEHLHLYLHLHLHQHLHELSMSNVNCPEHIVHISLHLHLYCPIDVQVQAHYVHFDLHLCLHCARIFALGHCTLAQVGAEKSLVGSGEDGARRGVGEAGRVLATFSKCLILCL